VSDGKNAKKNRGRSPARNNSRITGLALLAGFSLVLGANGFAAGQGRLNVILIVVDALRADHLGFAGYPLPTTPVIDRLARNALIGANVYAQANWTAPAMASLMSGTYPAVHKITKSPEAAQDRFAVLPKALSILPQPLHAAGYFTAAVSSCEWISPSSGYGKGFDQFLLVERKDETVIHEAIGLLRSRKPGPFFLYLHLLDVHDYFNLRVKVPRFSPSAAPPSPKMRALGQKPRAEIYRWLGDQKNAGGLAGEDLDYLRDRYDFFLNRTDGLIGELIGYLEKAGLADRTAVILTADHGESFSEHGRLIHGGDSLYNEVLRIPLIIHNRALFRRPKIIKENAQSLDIFPTVLDLLDLEPVEVSGTPQLQGTNLLARKRDGIVLCVAGNKMKILDRRWSFIRNRPGGDAELYDLDRDPGETRNLAAENPDVVRRMTDLLSRKIAASLVLSKKILPEDAPIDENTKQRLKSLGYIK